MNKQLIHKLLENALKDKIFKIVSDRCFLFKNESGQKIIYDGKVLKESKEIFVMSSDFYCHNGLPYFRCSNDKLNCCANPEDEYDYFNNNGKKITPDKYRKILRKLMKEYYGKDFNSQDA